MDIKVRPATCEDGQALSALRRHARAADEKPAMSPEEFSAAYQRFLDEGLRSGASAHWIAEVVGGADVEGRIVAHLVVQRVDLVPRPCKIRDAMGIITDLFTLLEFRRRCIGQKLLESARGWARDNDLELLAVWSSDEALEWYRRRGFARADDVFQQFLRP